MRFDAGPQIEAKAESENKNPDTIIVMDSKTELPMTRVGFVQCKRIVLELLINERQKIDAMVDEAVKRGDGVTASKLIGKGELLQDLERKIFSLEPLAPSSH